MVSPVENDGLNSDMKKEFYDKCGWTSTHDSIKDLTVLAVQVVWEGLRLWST